MAIKKRRPGTRRSSRPGATVEQRLQEDPGASKAVERLVKDGCERDQLQNRLHLLADIGKGAFTGLESFELWFGQNRKQFKRTTQKIRDWASIIEGLNRLPYARLEEQQVRELMDRLPVQLRQYADFLDAKAAGLVQPRQRWTEHITRFSLTHYVIERTPRPHDPEVATLISVLLNKPGYSANEQKTWRATYYGRFLDQHLKSQRASKLSPPSRSGPPSTG